VLVWDDENANGIMEDGEPGLEGVELFLVNDNGARTRLSNPGEGSTAHQVLKTNSEGKVTFSKVPAGMNIRVQVKDPPAAAIPTHRNKGGNDDADSDLNASSRGWETDRFNLNSFHQAGTYGRTAIGLRMPKTVVVRAFHDVNKQGVQNDAAVPLEGVRLQLLFSNKSPIPESFGGNAHEILTTGADGRVSFTSVKQGSTYVVKVLEMPAGLKPTHRNKGGNDQLDSDLRTNLFTDSFSFPNNIDEIYDLRDVGFMDV